MTDITTSRPSVTLGAARRIVAAAEARAAEQGIAIATTVVDESGVLKCFSRMDGAPLMAIDASRRKALTAVGLGLPTGQAWYDLVKDDPIMLEGVRSLEHFTFLGGGRAIEVGGAVVGAIGVSGGHYRQDEACVDAALASI